jgi:tripartite-type tricarboxylate transporter receptor subunit TctC
MLARAGGLDLAIVPYKGSAPLTTDLMGGQVPAAITVVSQVRTLHEAGKVRVLATSGARRSLALPDVPTFRELGYAAIEGSGWQAVHTRAGTPASIVERLSAAIRSTIARPDVTARLLALGLEPVGSTAEELERRTAQDAARWAPIVKASGFRADE